LVEGNLGTAQVGSIASAVRYIAKTCFKEVPVRFLVGVPGICVAPKGERPLVTRYQIRLSTYLQAVLFAAITIKGMLLVAWLIRVTG